ncbi:YdcF family protein [Peribacillus asahii]|uniref:YdcF family protein n=1 Tax=Peribacillus asahii TaxID=228899 RepID=A0A398B4A9_9BACI|nr:YdcF family protein [Peribacillus asahii]RID84745.1 YdcF family protein [Peribacillus asahii]
MKILNNEMKVEKRKRKRWVILLGLFLCVPITILTVLYFPKLLLIDFLFYEEEPVKADVIILLSGDSQRMEKVAELYHAGFADKVLLTNARVPGSTVEYAESFGIPRDNLLTENEATSTYENALYVKDIVLDHGFGSALVVTSNYHMRRTRLAYERVFHDTNVSFTYVPYHHDSITRDSWEENEGLFKREYKKLMGGYFLYYDGIITPIRKKFEEVIE